MSTMIPLRMRAPDPRIASFVTIVDCVVPICLVGKGGKNRRRGKNEGEESKRDLLFKEEGQGEGPCSTNYSWRLPTVCCRSAMWGRCRFHWCPAY